MNNLFTYFLYGATAIALAVSFFKSRKKTALALRRAWKMFLNTLPQFMAILLVIGLLLAVVSPDVIRTAVGAQSGLAGMLLSAALGSVAIIPALIAFPIAARLLQSGAGVMQIAVFISTLTTVGFATLPIEVRYIGKKAALLRNLLALALSFASAYAVGEVLR